MKNITKPDAAKPVKATTPAQPAPSPAIKTKAPAKPKTKASVAAPVINVEPAPAAAPLVKNLAVAPQSTVIVAQVDVGFGRSLYVRGDGPGLNWEKGVMLDCVSHDKWSISLTETSKPFVFKFLINDQTWCRGEDFIAQPGHTVTVSPIF